MRIITGMVANVKNAIEQEMKRMIGIFVDVEYVGKKGTKIMIGMGANVVSVKL